MSAQPLRVLLLEDDAGDARLFQASLGPRQAGFAVVHVTRLAEALHRLAGGGFDAIVLDLSVPDSQGLETFRRIHQQAPAVPSLVLTGLDDEGLAIRAVQAGAQDYLIKGHGDSSRVGQAIRYAIGRQQSINQQLQRAQGSTRGCLVGVVGAKGGAGTTTVVLNLAATLAARRHAVIAAELCPGHGTFAEQTGQKPGLNLAQLLVLEPHQISSAAVTKCLVSLPFGPRALYGPQKVSEFAPIDPERAQAMLKTLAGMAEFVVIDIPNGPWPANLAGLRLCDLVVLVTEPEPAAIAAGRLVLEWLRSEATTAAVLGAIVVNRAALASGVQVSAIRAELGTDILGVIPPAGEVCVAALRRGLPVVLSQPDHIAAVALTDIAGRVLAARPATMVAHG
jgi:MinD-like ATPase involved in chromosome partitioning or flagellar assembly/CheY-like chemotaxis protein